MFQEYKGIIDLLCCLVYLLAALWTKYKRYKEIKDHKTNMILQKVKGKLIISLQTSKFNPLGIIFWTTWAVKENDLLRA